jgi:hypothetical protein
VSERTLPSQVAPERTAQVLSSKVTFNGNVGRISSTVVAANPEAGTRVAEFTRTDFEDALDKVSRPVKTTD